MIESGKLAFYGHSMEDYIRMFDLGHAELDKMHILDCSGFYSSFASEMEQENHRVVVANPFFAKPIEVMNAELENLETAFHDHIDENLESYFLHHPSLSEEMQHRQEVAKAALADLQKGIAQKRYLSENLEQLHFSDEAFDLALSSHFLFTYSNELSLDYHLAVIKELLRVSDEVRIFPLVTLEGKPSPHLGPVLQELTTHGIAAEVQQVSFEFQKGGNAMLVIDRDHCEVDAHENSELNRNDY